MHDEIYKAIRLKQEATERLRAMLVARGKFLGRGEANILWYVLDGKLYCDKSHTQLHLSGEYSEACDAFRRTRGKLPWE